MACHVVFSWLFRGFGCFSMVRFFEGGFVLSFWLGVLLMVLGWCLWCGCFVVVVVAFFLLLGCLLVVLVFFLLGFFDCIFGVLCLSSVMDPMCITRDRN